MYLVYFEKLSCAAVRALKKQFCRIYCAIHVRALKENRMRLIFFISHIYNRTEPSINP